MLPIDRQSIFSFCALNSICLVYLLAPAAWAELKRSCPGDLDRGIVWSFCLMAVQAVSIELGEKIGPEPRTKRRWRAADRMIAYSKELGCFRHRHNWRRLFWRRPFAAITYKSFAVRRRDRRIILRCNAPGNPPFAISSALRYTFIAAFFNQTLPVGGDAGSRMAAGARPR